MAQFQNPFLRGMLGAQEVRERSTANQIGTMGGLLSIQNQMEMAPVQRELMQLKLQQARQGPQPKWQVVERFNQQTGTKEKVLVDLNNPANVVPFGGQETRPLSFQNVGPSIVGLDPMTGLPRGAPIPTGVSPNTSATLGQSQQQFNTMFPIRAAQAGADIARLNWETGGGPAAIPGLTPPPMMPQNAPLAAPQATPQGMMIPPAVQAQRDAEAAAIRGREATGGGIPTSRVVQGSQPPGPQVFVPPGTQMGAIPGAQPRPALPPRLQAEVEASRLKEKVKPLTESQGRANLFGTRAAEADAILLPLENNISLVGLASKQAVQDTPGIGGPAGAIGNALLSKEQQMVEQAQRNFVNAVLRVESGAVINPSEFENAKKQYFPQPGDGAAVIEQKRKNRKTAIEGLNVMASPAGRPARRSTDATPGIDELIKKYTGR